MAPIGDLSQFARIGDADQSIVLVRPPIAFSANSYSTPVTLPIGIAYLAGFLQKFNYRVKILDAVGMDITRITRSHCRRFKFQGASFDRIVSEIPLNVEVIGISVMFSQEWPFVKKFIRFLRESFPRVKIVVGGEHASALAEFSLRDCKEIDFIIRGEGEIPLLQLSYQVCNNKDYSHINGLCFLEQGEFVQIKSASRIKNLDEIPWPAWHLLDLNPYFQPNFTMGISHGKNMPILATRGCPYRCTFCSSPEMWTTKYAMRSPVDVVKEIEFNIKTYGANSIDFFDLTAIIKKKWIIEFTDELKKRNIKIIWSLPSGTRSEALDAEVIQCLRDTGMELLVYAPESGSKTVLKEINKKINLSKMIQSILLAKQAKLVVKLNFIIGFPNETRVDVLNTLSAMWRLAINGVDDVDLAMFSPYPGSKLFTELLESGEIQKIDDGYFEELLVLYDFTAGINYCRKMSQFELSAYRIVGMSVFYLISYILFPSRIFRLLSYIGSKKTFEARSLFEQRIYDYIARVLLTRARSGE